MININLDLINKNRAEIGLKPITGSKNIEILNENLPEATCVATMGQWNENGRKIKKGEHCTYLKGASYQKDKKTGKYIHKGYYSFRVFDYSQTEPMTNKGSVQQ